MGGWETRKRELGGMGVRKGEIGEREDRERGMVEGWWDGGKGQ